MLTQMGRENKCLGLGGQPISAAMLQRCGSWPAALFFFFLHLYLLILLLISGHLHNAWRHAWVQNPSVTQFPHPKTLP